MRSFLILSSITLCMALFTQPAAAQRSRHHQGQHHGRSHHYRSYPRYYGATWPNPGWSISGRSGNVAYNFSFGGNSYYGDPWGPYFYNRFGYYNTDAFVAGNPVLFSNGYSLNGFYPILPGQGYSPPAVYPYSNVPGVLPTLPAHPQWNDPNNAASNLPLNQTLQEDLKRWQDKNYLPEPSERVKRYVVPSTRQAKELSLRNRVKGDEYFKKLDFRRAYERYKFAASLAKDVPTPFFRKGFALVALGQFDRAAYEFKQGLALDPTWPSTGESLNELFGPDHQIAKDSMIHQVADWVKKDIRDPDRLFVFGVVLYFNGQEEQAIDVLRTGARLAGRGDYFLAFLNPQPVEGQQTIPQKQPAAGHVVNPANTRPPAFEATKKPQLQPQGKGAQSPSMPLTLPPPPSKQKAPQINNQNQGLPPEPQDSGAPGEPLIPLPEPAKSQQAPLLIAPQ